MADGQLETHLEAMQKLLLRVAVEKEGCFATNHLSDALLLALRHIGLDESNSARAELRAACKVRVQIPVVHAFCDVASCSDCKKVTPAEYVRMLGLEEGLVRGSPAPPHLITDVSVCRKPSCPRHSQTCPLITSGRFEMPDQSNPWLHSDYLTPEYYCRDFYHNARGAGLVDTFITAWRPSPISATARVNLLEERHAEAMRAVERRELPAPDLPRSCGCGIMCRGFLDGCSGSGHPQTMEPLPEPALRRLLDLVSYHLALLAWEPVVDAQVHFGNLPDSGYPNPLTEASLREWAERYGVVTAVHILRREERRDFGKGGCWFLLEGTIHMDNERAAEAFSSDFSGTTIIRNGGYLWSDVFEVNARVCNVFPIRNAPPRRRALVQPPACPKRSIIPDPDEEEAQLERRFGSL